MLTKNLKTRTLSEWLIAIEAKHPSVIQLGLDRIAEVAAKADLAQFDCPVVTIAGTNGKGSTLSALALLIDQSGKRYGTYTSPHLMHFQERIRINGQCVSEQQLCEAFEMIESLSQGIALTYFEFTTLAAFYIFKQAKLDYIILEVGLGGRLDAVNIVKPNIAIITSISFDHQEWLGNTLADIANEKAGILREDIFVVLSHEATHPVVLAATEKLNNKVLIENKDFYYQEIETPTHYFPKSSVSLALAAYSLLVKQHPTLPSVQQAVKAIENQGMIGRFHIVKRQDRTYIFDVAHNEGGAAWLGEQLKRRAEKGNFVALWSSLEDKDHAAILKPLTELIKTWYVCKVKDTMRACSSHILADKLKQQSITNIHQCENVEEALKKATDNSSKEDEIVVFGSFYTVAEAYQVLGDDWITFGKNGLYYENAAS